MHIIISAYNTLSTCNGEAKTILMFRIQYNNRLRTDNTVTKLLGRLPMQSVHITTNVVNSNPAQARYTRCNIMY
jgi:hypothetical protein